ncbi:hypothetical protein [Halarcobacter ebronensis]|uniref:Uncharacterized protein n=1 Tax=Halarcobacter ebronensis TaxID=1462615 RepID=A0A4Q1ARA5_9BACT|nr:hypothetical protein [Halarcobacter ebronensis]QKF81579.1 hypothetical protein AEBR_1083 [Halarcobacter ebronensis]RXK05507.1 hypothetical protein CRV07_08325 [Halarcobacter ebronensis]
MFFKKFFEYLAKATLPIYRFENNRLYFRFDNDQYYKYELLDYDIKTRHDSYVIEGYTLSNADIHLEYIKVESDVSWNVEVVSAYEDLIKEKLKIGSLKVLEEKNIKTYTFKTYKADDSFVFHLIFIYTTSSNLLIIDTKGTLYKELISRFDSTYEYKYKEEQKGDINFNISIIKENSMRSYFGL